MIRRAARSRLLLVGVLVFAIGGGLVALAIQSTPAPVSGVVLALDGSPIAEASVTMGSAQVTSADDGTFTIPEPPIEAWVRADASGYLPRLRPARGGDAIVLRMTPDDGRTIAMTFGGDVMFGRRYFDPDENGDASDGLLSATSTAASHERLLAGVAPMLAAADLTIVNLETPLVAEDPYPEPSAPRPSSFHPAKEFVFASGAAVAAALADVGVDVVDLGNDHQYDRLDGGVLETLTHLDEAGFTAGARRMGAGANDADAWAPAIQVVRGQRVAFLGCTTIDGAETPPLYTALSSKSGAAECSEDAIRREVAAARTGADLVVLMIHGGFEYERAPSERIRALTAVAHEAGAAFVINGHPHVVGGFSREGGFTAWTMGNLASDQLVWPTFASYLLTVYVRDGLVVRAVADPVLLDRFQPAPVSGPLADEIAAQVAAMCELPCVVEDGAVEIAPGESTPPPPRAVQVAAGAIVALPPELVLGSDTAAGSLEVGRDLLWSTGSFDDNRVDGVAGTAPLWGLPSPSAVRVPDGSPGGGFVQLARAGSDRNDAVVAPEHRIPVSADTRLSLLLRTRSASELVLQLSWYNDLKNASQAQSFVRIPASSEWTATRIDVVAPAHAAAVLPLIRLAAPTAGRVMAEVDDVRLIAWTAAQGGAPSLGAFVRSADSRTLPLEAFLLPGAPAAAAADPVPLWTSGVALSVAPVDPLPPGPSRATESDD